MPNKFETPITKIQKGFLFRFCGLSIVWNLVLVIWKFAIL